MTTKELISEVTGKESGWCVCVMPNLEMAKHVEESLVEKIVERVVARERERCRRIANHYEEGPETQAVIAGAIRQKIEQGVEFA